MNLTRRDVLVGLGVTAVGGSVTLGSSAFTQVGAARNISIQVNKDSNSLIAVDAGTPQSVNEADGEVEIDTENHGGAFNENATVEIGNFGNPDTNPAFSVTNNLTNSINLTLNLREFDSDSVSLKFETEPGSDGDQTELSANNKATQNGIKSGDVVNVAVQLDTETTDIAGKLNITATRS